MKKILLLFVLISISLTASAQNERNVWKFKTTAISYLYTDKGAKEFTEPEETSLLIVVNHDNEKINVFSQEEQEFDIVEYYDWEVDEDGDDVQDMRAVDQDGIQCTLTYIKLNSKGGDLRQLYVRYSNITYVYYMYNS